MVLAGSQPYVKDAPDFDETREPTVDDYRSHETYYDHHRPIM